MNYSKQRNEQHLIDSDGEKLLRSCLPRHWILREYRPDYGLDFSLEIFDEIQDVAGNGKRYQTLGEHIFIQLKSVTNINIRPLTLFSRGNVEKQHEELDRNEVVGVIDTIRFSLETSELVTVERMGTGVPVMLVIADLSRAKCHFVCLNDYIDKILIPRFSDYTLKATRTIHVPCRNEVANSIPGYVALRWYAKRAKLYSAFQRFFYQKAELDYATDVEKGIKLAQYFATKIARYDFWDNTEMCFLIGCYGNYVKNFLNTGSPNICNSNAGRHLFAAESDLESLWIEINELWRLLALLSRTYEDVWREWFLPTGLGHVSS